MALSLSALLSIVSVTPLSVRLLLLNLRHITALARAMMTSKRLVGTADARIRVKSASSTAALRAMCTRPGQSSVALFFSAVTLSQFRFVFNMKLYKVTMVPCNKLLLKYF